jgi:hypothetical protein
MFIYIHNSEPLPIQSLDNCSRDSLTPLRGVGLGNDSHSDAKAALPLSSSHCHDVLVAR